MSFRTSSASSFERLDSPDTENEVNTSFLTVSEAVGSEDDVRSVSPSVHPDEDVDPEEAMRKELEALRIQCANQRLHIELLKIEREEQKKDVKSDETAFKFAIEGKWKFSSSTNLQPFLETRRQFTDSTDLDEVLFHVAEQNIVFRDGTVKLFDSVGNKEFNVYEAKIGVPDYSEEGSKMTYIAGDVMKTVRIQKKEGDEEDVEERFVKDGELHVVIRRYGATCTRIYNSRQNHVTNISGLWKQTNQPNRTLSLEIKDGKFFRKIRNELNTENDSSDHFVIGEVTNKWKTWIEGNVLMQRMKTSDGEVIRKRFVENGLLISVEESKEKPERWTFERVGEPLSE